MTVTVAAIYRGCVFTIFGYKRWSSLGPFAAAAAVSHSGTGL